MSDKKRWVKIICTLAPTLNEQGRKAIAKGWTESFEIKFHVEHLYYARYTDLTASRFEISAQVAATDKQIEKYFKAASGIKKVKIELRGTGSLAHAYAYQAVKHLKAFDVDAPNDNDFLDVVHWMTNMRGLDYAREARLMAYRAFEVIHGVATSQDNMLRIAQRLQPEILKVAKELGAEDQARRIAEELAKADSKKPWFTGRSRSSNDLKKRLKKVESPKLKKVKKL